MERAAFPTVLKGMLFYQFVVTRNSPISSHPRRDCEAKVMLRVDIDVDQATEGAVQYLEARGWMIKSVRRAQLVETPEEFGNDSVLLALHHDAAQNGLACAITALRARTQPRSPEEVPADLPAAHAAA